MEFVIVNTVKATEEKFIKLRAQWYGHMLYTDNNRILFRA
jgi:hypothetical protein